MKLQLQIWLLLFSLVGCIERSKQELTKKKILMGAYTENSIDTNLLFKGRLILIEDSLFSYKSLGVFKDTASGTFSLSADTLFFHYFDGYNDSLRKVYHDNGRPVPIELLGYGINFDGRPLQLVVKADTLFYTDIDRKHAEEKGFYYLLNQ